MTETVACTRFFSTNGCPYGSECNFQHYIPRRVTSPKALSDSEHSDEHSETDTSTETGYKSRLCYRFNTAEGCRYGKYCFFAHGEEELSISQVLLEQPTGPCAIAEGAEGVCFGSFLIKTSAVGAVIGKAGSNVKEIRQVTGVKLHIRDVENDPSARRVEIYGSVEQVEAASAMVKKLAEESACF